MFDLIVPGMFIMCFYCRCMYTTRILLAFVWESIGPANNTPTMQISLEFPEMLSLYHINAIIGRVCPEFPK